MQHTKYIIYIILLLPLFAKAQSTILTPDSVFARIYSNNDQLKVYELQAESFKAEAEGATAWMAPMVGAGTFMTPYPFQKLMDGRDKGSWMIRAEQEIPNRKKQEARKKYIASKANLTAYSKMVAFNNLKASARSFYYTWLIAEKRIKVLEANEVIMDMMKKIEEVRYPYNQSQLGNTYTISARIMENNNKIELEQSMIMQAKARLHSLMNLNRNESFSIDTTYTPAFNMMMHDTTVLATHRQDIHQMNENMYSMRLNIEAAKMEKRPDFKVQLDHMTGFSSMMPNTYSIMGMISIPIAPWASKMYKQEAKAMEYSIAAMQKEKEAMLIETEGMVTGMQLEITAAQKRIQTMQNHIIPTMQHALDAHFLSYQENKVGITVVIDAWEALNMMQMDVLDEQLNLYKMIAEYERETFQ